MSDACDDSIEPPTKMFDRFDLRGTHLSELLVFVDGPPLSMEVFEAHGINVTFVPKKRIEARWFANEIYLLPEPPHDGAWFASVEVRSIGPEFSKTYWTLRFAVAPADPPPEDMRDRAFPGAFPDNLQVLLQLGQIEGYQDVRVQARYFTRRDRIPSGVDSIAPWLLSPFRPEGALQRWTSWDVAGYPALTQVTLAETPDAGVVRLKADGALRTVISVESLDAIDAALWADLAMFLTANDRAIVRTEPDPHEPG